MQIPCSFRRSFYPDGNRTQDQSVQLSASATGTGGHALLTRTYYASTETVLPGPVMQPIWSSVRAPDGSTDFGLSYHRAFASPAYDDFHDIYLQRWRLEDKPWQVLCVNRLSGAQRSVAIDEFTADGAYCQEPLEYKVRVRARVTD